MSIKIGRMAGNLMLLTTSLATFSACVSAAPAEAPPSPTPGEVVTSPTVILSSVVPRTAPPSVMPASATPSPARPSVTPLPATAPPATPEPPTVRKSSMALGSNAEDEEATQIVSVTSQMAPNNSLIFDLNVELDQPARVWVEYYPANDESARIKTPLSEKADAKHQLQVMRLRPETVYNYRVFAAPQDTDSPEETGEASDSFPG